MAPGVEKQVPVAEHPADSRKPQSSPLPQSALVVQVPPSPTAPEPLLDPELPLEDPEPLLDPELPLVDPEPPLDPELPLVDPDPHSIRSYRWSTRNRHSIPELPLEDPELPLDPEVPLDPELPPELLPAAASLELNETAVPEQPMA